MATGNAGTIRRTGAAGPEKRNMAINQAATKSKAAEKSKAAGKGSSYDYLLLFSIILLFSIGLLVIYSGSQYTAMLETGQATYYFKRQFFIGGIGLVAAIIVSKLDYHLLKKKFMPFLEYMAALVFPVLTLAMGVASHGKTRWISIAGIRFQPAEVTKVALIVFLAAILDITKHKVNNTKFFFLLFVMCMFPALLIFFQNLSSGFIVIFIVAVILFVASNKGEWFIAAGITGILMFAAAKPLVRLIVEKTGYTGTPSQYYLRRVLAWALPEVYTSDAYQTTQGLYAIGSGGMFGRGLGESIQKFGKIPEVQNDMIFTVICEEFGFAGAVCIVALYLVILYRIYQIGRNAKDRMGCLICVGVMAHIGIQVVLNLAVVTGVFPNTGVTLPFISYGGSAILITMIEFGLVLSVSNQITDNNRHA